MMMIRRMRHAAAVLAMACVMTVMMPAQMMTAFAANARIAFSDPSATVGGKIKVNMKITSSSNLANADVMLAYDSSALEFVSGTNADGGAYLGIPYDMIELTVPENVEKVMLRERNYVVPENVQNVFVDVCAHRLALRPQARVEGVAAKQVLEEIMTKIKPAHTEE